jgi:hypothetical protein
MMIDLKFWKLNLSGGKNKMIRYWLYIKVKTHVLEENSNLEMKIASMTSLLLFLLSFGRISLVNQLLKYKIFEFQTEALKRTHSFHDLLSLLETETVFGKLSNQ